jgi:hypothetical protein
MAEETFVVLDSSLGETSNLSPEEGKSSGVTAEIGEPVLSTASAITGFTLNSLPLTVSF